MSNDILKTRREFLRSTLVGGAVSATVPAFLARTFSALHVEAADQAQPRTGKDSPILVVIQMAGGNDGLNTVVPISNDEYYKARTTLSLRANLLKLNDDFALHPSLVGLKAVYDSGQLGIIQGVGYPNPNRSHFRSTEIWQTASDANRFEKYGWLGRYFDNACKGSDSTVGVSIGRQTPQAFTGPRPLGVSLENPDSYRIGGHDQPKDDESAGSMDFMSKINAPSGGAEANSGSTISSLSGRLHSGLSPLDFLERTALDAQVSSDQILKVSRSARNRSTYPAAPLGNSLSLVARLIGGGLATRVYYVSQGGYDTHTNQAATHERLLREYSSSVKAFLEDLQAQGNADRVLLLSFSEFGRRVAQNANGGTDHGAAAPLFVFGPKVKPGFLGTFPSLAPRDLVNGDPKFSTDFRSVYAGILKSWLQTDPRPILGRAFTPFQCTATSV